MYNQQSLALKILFFPTKKACLGGKKPNNADNVVYQTVVYIQEDVIHLTRLSTKYLNCIWDEHGDELIVIFKGEDHLRGCHGQTDSITGEK